LSVADRYGALREERSYKEAMSKEDALAIIKEDVDSGIISEEVFDALKKSV
jgi:HD-GYP domain-containing protein (c-di-GMP phosphodiesterase class II)